MRERDAPRADDGRSRAARPERPLASLLGLQRTAGNRAALRLLRKGRTTAEFDWSRPKTAGNKGGAWYVKQARADEAAKNKPLDRPKYKTEWLIKKGGAYGDVTEDVASVLEVLGAQLFAALAGERFTGKHRIVTGPAVFGLPTIQAPNYWVASKTVTGLTTWDRMTEEDREARTQGVVRGLGRSLVVSLLLGESDWNAGNFGFAPVTGGYEFRKIDFGMAFEFAFTPLIDPGDVPALLKAFKVDGLFPVEAVDPKEIAETLSELEQDGKARILSVVGGFEQLFAQLSKTPRLEAIREELLARLGKLCAG